MFHFARGILMVAFMAIVLLFVSPGRRAAEPSGSSAPKDTPRFSLSTNRTYGTSDKPRVWINYRALDHLDFRLYRVKDPVKFFKQLNDPHQMGEEEKQQVSSSYAHSPSILDRLQSLKGSAYVRVKEYVRSQLGRSTRTHFNEKFREGEQRPLNVADFARVPLLNPDQKVRTWRQMLSPVANDYDTRFVTLGRLDPGVYLVEAVYEDLRAYTVAVVTDLNVITKTTPQRELLVYAVDRRSGEPRVDVQVEVIKGQKVLGSGKTDGMGIMRTQVAAPENRETEPQDTDPLAGSVSREDYLIMASGHDQFAISDLEPFFFGGTGEDQGPRLTSYIYTDRPVYRPAQTV